MAVAVVGQPRPALAANPALLRLLQVLRDKGSITAQEYEDIRAVADQPDTPAAPPAPPRPRGCAGAACRRRPPWRAPAELTKALAGKWYERIGIRGYSQLRYADVASQSGAVLEVPADRSVNPNESFVLRRGRLVFSGDVADHLSLYAQTDFNGSPGSADYALQMRDLYGDVWLDKAKTYRVRVGQSKVPFGWVNLQSSSNRAPMERPDALNSAVEGERDLGAALMWAPATAKQRFRELGNVALKGSGDYGVLAAGLYSGQGLNRSDQNGDPHAFVRAAYPFKTKGGQFYELGVQAYRGRFVVPTQAITVGRRDVHAGPGRRRACSTSAWRSTAVVYPAAVRRRSRMDRGHRPAALRRPAQHRRAPAARRLRAGQLPRAERGRHLAAVHALELLRRRPQVRPERARLRRERGGRRRGVRALGRGRDDRHVHPHLHAHPHQHLPLRLTRDANRVGFQVQWNY